jgi:Family of unknown function (DUF5677)
MMHIKVMIDAGGTLEEVATRAIEEAINSGQLARDIFESSTIVMPVGSDKAIFIKGKFHHIEDKTEVRKKQAEAIKQVAVPAMRKLVQFGRDNIDNWITEWATSKPDTTAMSSQIPFLVFGSLFSQVVDTLDALADITAKAAILTASSGLIAPIAVLTRNQLESHWALSYLLADDAQIDNRCAAYTYAHLQALMRHNIRRIKEQNSPSEPILISAEQQRVAEATKDSYFDIARAEYSTLQGKGVKKPSWYKLCGVNDLRSLAKICGEDDVYEDKYDFLSALAHSQAPSVGEVADYDEDTNFLVMAPQLSMVIALSNYAAVWTNRVFELLISKLMGSHKPDRDNFSASWKAKIDADKFAINGGASDG